MKHSQLRIPANLTALFRGASHRRQAQREHDTKAGAVKGSDGRWMSHLPCRVWLVRYDHPDGEPSGLATALEPAEPEPMPRHLAEVYVETFNRAARARAVATRAVAVPVEVHYEGEPCPGRRVVVGV